MEAIKPDYRLSSLLKMVTPNDNNPDSNETYGQWVLIFHPSKGPDELPSLDDFLTTASGPSDYQFNQNFATKFHDLLVSSVYAYLCLMKQLKFYISKKKDEKIRDYSGLFSNAATILYHVSHSNAMKAYFSHPGLPFTSPTYAGSIFLYKKHVDDAVHDIFTRLKWDTEMLKPKKGGDGEQANIGGDGEEDMNPHENFVEDFKENDARSIYRRSLMSFVDHHAGLRLLERRSSSLPANEMIKLSLIAIKQPPTLQYVPWGEMEKVIHKTCQDFRPTVTISNPVEGQDMIKKIKEHIERISGPGAYEIHPFKILLTERNCLENGSDFQCPDFRACIHCESSLAAILCEIHRTPENSKLRELFKVCPSSHSSSFEFTP
jgi:hypothetical protein